MSEKVVQKFNTKNKALASGTKSPPLPGANLQAVGPSGSKTASQMAVEAAFFKVSSAREMYSPVLPMPILPGLSCSHSRASCTTSRRILTV